jgi:hypothetical protein
MAGLSLLHPMAFAFGLLGIFFTFPYFTVSALLIGKRVSPIARIYI